MTPDGLVVAVDGGGVKTDLALVESSGAVVSVVRGGPSQAHYLGVEGTVDVLEGLLEEAAARAGLGRLERPFAAVAQLLLAGADLPEEVSAIRAGLERQNWSARLAIDNDMPALLRSGTDRGWGVAVVCGTGINCLGVGGGGGMRRVGIVRVGIRRVGIQSTRGQVPLVRTRVGRLGRRARHGSSRPRRRRARRRWSRTGDRP